MQRKPGAVSTASLVLALCLVHDIIGKCFAHAISNSNDDMTLRTGLLESRQDFADGGFDHGEGGCGCCSHSFEDLDGDPNHTDGPISFSLMKIASGIVDKAAQACPWLLAGLVATVLLQEFIEGCLPPSAVRAYLSIPNECKSTLPALMKLCVKGAFLGLATPLCSCGTIPMALALASNGCAPAAVSPRHEFHNNCLVPSVPLAFHLTVCVMCQSSH